MPHGRAVAREGFLSILNAVLVFQRLEGLQPAGSSDKHFITLFESSIQAIVLCEIKGFLILMLNGTGRLKESADRC